MSGKLENNEPNVMAYGLNTNKPATFGSTVAVTGVATFTATPVFSGTLPKLNAPLTTHPTTAAINTTATATAAEVATGYITSTSAAGVSITMPTGTLLGAALGAVQGTVFDLFIDNTAGANVVTLVAGTNAILSDAGTVTAASFGDVTVGAGVTGIARFTLMFSSATAYVYTRTA